MAKSDDDAKAEFVPLAIIGMGGVFPKARGLRQFWANIKNKVDAISDVPPTHWSPADYYDADPKAADKVYAYKGGFLESYDFDPSEFGLSPNTLEATDPAQLFGLVAAKMALADAGYPVDQESWDRARVSTILGVTGTLELAIPLGARLSHPLWRKALREAGISAELAEDVVARISDGYVPWQEASFPGLLGNVVAGRIANRFNLGGTNCVVDAACGSSLAALHLASLELGARRASLVITGGVDTFNDIFMYTCFTKTPALSPSGHAKSFDAKADGTTLGEGVGMLVLKRLDDARRDGDQIHAVIRGLGSSSDGRGKSIYAPSAEGQTRALREAYRVSGVSPASVELVEAHGTGTAVGDGIEVGALAGVYKESGRTGVWCALGSVKSMIGHTKAAAGSASLIKAAFALRHKVFPPTLKVSQPHPVLAQGDTPFYVSQDKRPWLAASGQARRAAVSALGFGGTNFHAILEEARPEKTETDWDGEAQIIALSAATAAALADQLGPWSQPKSWDEVRVGAAASRKSFEAGAAYRLCLQAGPGDDLPALARKAVQALESRGSQSSWSLPEGIYFGRGRPGKVGVLFPGQGAQYTGMARDLVCAFPEAFDALAEADAMLEEGARLSERMFPRGAWSAQQKEEQESALRATDVAQPALGAAALAAWRVLTRFGLKADAAAGHSYGELVALHVAGCFDAASLHALSRLRGTLMKGAGGDPGAMLAVSASLEQTQSILSEEKLELTIANRNAPKQNVLSGATREIERASKILEARGVRAVRLPVAAAFHSPLVAGALKPFAAALEKVKWAKPSLKVYANTSGEPYGEDAKNARALLSEQLARPVEFVRLITRMHDDGIRTFIEVGAGARLSALAGQILAEKEFSALALDASNGKKNGLADMARLLAQLSALGYALDLVAWQGGDAGIQDCRPKPKMSIALSGAAYRSTPKRAFPAKTAVAPAVAADAGLLGQALAAAQASIDALGRLQEQTAALHLQFLQSQEGSQREIQALVEQQQALSARIGGKAAPLVARAAPILAKPAALPPAQTGVLPVLIAVVSQKTGYPADTINPDMDLEGDLGIDSIKRVEILSAVREKLPGAPQVKPEHLGTLRTLKLIAEYLSGAPSNDVLPVLLAIVSQKTGYPQETLKPDMDLEGDLGIDSIKRVEILSAVREKLPDAPQVKPEHLGTLRTLQSIADYLSQKSAPSAPPQKLAAGSLVSRVPALVPVGPRDIFPLQGVVIAVSKDSGLDQALARELRGKGLDADVIALEKPGELPAQLGALIVVAPARPASPGCPWSAASEEWIKNAFGLISAAGASFARRGVRGLIVTVTRLDGALGFDGAAGQDPIFGGLAGLMKTAAREWPKVACRAIDIDPALALDQAAALLAKELGYEGPGETAVTLSGVRTVALESRATTAGPAALRPGDVVIVTGGARGVTAACALELARACRVKLVLVGRSPLPQKEPASLSQALTSAQLRRALAEQEPGLPPKTVGEKAQSILAAREISATMDALAKLGVEAGYACCDVRDEAAVRALVAQTVRDLGPVRGLLHGAGVLADKKILDKTAAQISLVLDTKLSGLRHFLNAVDMSELRLLSLFSSSTARYGRAGQSDYAIANEALNKAAQALARTWPTCRVNSIGWGPWDGGMVDESLKRLFAAEGVGVIGLAEGAAHLLAQSSGGAVESVAVAALPPERLATVFERVLTLEDAPILRSHVLAGRSVVPLALSAEWLAHAALHGHPGLVFMGFDDLRAVAAIAVAQGQSTAISVRAAAAQKSEGRWLVPTEIRGEDGALRVSANILLGERRLNAPQAGLRVSGTAYAGGVERAYAQVLFHGPGLRLIRSVDSLGAEGVVIDTLAAASPSEWTARPPRDQWLADPGALDAAFQAMILWTQETMGAPSLPSFAARYRQYAPFPSGGVRVVIQATSRADTASADMEFLDEDGALVARLEGYECTAHAALAQAFDKT